ncbi:hypothetical protein A2Z33_01345 [Candidatus Gottesmanbacteria bacterium RBG_16_52_11]|uniref:Tryptophan synthase beta chain-like PALP domain-containing protein n=1 Tax=Candidatus Gottesmanbacteria bacterium RBG_16_52_11 TaxID=1798374 RepID=A0A1F5YNZ7_9BACT|nr:MAG: hypothetical protein A2Z33_01345 [Candidatus Gottesmanbacteria bacterium RBG_16_52_11]
MTYRNGLAMGEGRTPLIRLTGLEKKIGWNGGIWAKAEYANPTGSFKDRGSLAEIRNALKMGMKGVICASTGNMAASLAAYAARAEIPCMVIVPAGTPATKLNQARMYGAVVSAVAGSYDRCVGIAAIKAKNMKYLLCGDYKTRRIGQRRIGAELADAGIRFDAFICPVGNGTVGCAVSEGFALKNRFPAFIGVQGRGSDPVYQAWIRGSADIRVINRPQTSASAMKVGNPLDGRLCLSLIYKTGGQVLSVDDTRISVAQQTLAITEGIFVEKASAATVAALRFIDKSKSVVLILTGNGLKEGGENYGKG